MWVGWGLVGRRAFTLGVPWQRPALPRPALNELGRHLPSEGTCRAWADPGRGSSRREGGREGGWHSYLGAGHASHLLTANAG